jgi:phage terminase large subunit-like protein
VSVVSFTRPSRKCTVTMIQSVLYAKRVRKSGNILTLVKRKSNMFCVINTELNDVIAMFLMKSDATRLYL